MYLIELIRRFSRVGDTVGGAFGGSGTACLAANIEKRSSIYIDIDSKQDQMCRPRWQRAQQKIMAEHMMHIRRSMQDYVKRLEDTLPFANRLQTHPGQALQQAYHGQDG